MSAARRRSHAKAPQAGAKAPRARARSVAQRLARARNLLSMIVASTGAAISGDPYMSASDIAEGIREAAAEALDELHWVEQTESKLLNSLAPTDDDRARQGGAR